MSLDQFAWNCFYNSGNIEAFLLYKQEEALKYSENQSANQKIYESGENRGDCPSGNQIW